MTTAFWKLRRFGPRALKVVGRHKGESSAIAAHEAPLDQKTRSFAAAYDQVVRLRAATADAVRALHATVRAWLPLAQRDVAGVSSADCGARPEVPDDVIGTATELLAQVKAAPPGSAGPLPYQAACVAELERDLAGASQAVREAEAADPGFAGLMRQLRDLGATLDAELQSVRATLSARLGRRDRDLQKMRPHAVCEPDDDDDATAPPPTPGVPPAAPGVNSPVR